MKKKTLTKPFKHTQIAGILQEQITGGILKIGDRLPSLRAICTKYGVSQSTALAVYHQLEIRGLAVSRPRSGYFVCPSTPKFLSLPAVTSPQQSGLDGDIDSLVEKVYDSPTGGSRMLSFSLGVPDNALLPVARLNKSLVRAMRRMEGSGVNMVPPQG